MMLLEICSGFPHITSSLYSNYGELKWSPLVHVENIWTLTLLRLELSHMNFVLDIDKGGILGDPRGK
jgi:hypothetical protein